MSAPRLLAPTTISGGVPTAGAGTLNTIALWTPDGSTLGNSLLTQSGNIVTNASGAIRALGTTQTSPAFTRHDTTTSGIYFPATNEIGFTISNQHAMFISSGRLVGIGTVSPGARLHCVGADGSYQFAVSGTTKGIRFLTTASVAQIDAVDQTLSASYQPLFLNGSTVTLAYSGGAALTVNNTGSVGVGITNPYEKCQVYGDLKVGVLASGAFISLADEGSTAKNIGIYRAAGATSLSLGGYSAITFHASANSLGAQTERMRIDATTGNVGIGTASPATFAASGSVVLGQNITSQQWALKIFGGNDANRAPVISLFRAGNAESIIGQIKDGTRSVLALGTGGGVASFNDATLATYSQLKIGTDYADMSGTGYGLKLPATNGTTYNTDPNTLDCYAEKDLTATMTPGTSGTITLSSSTLKFTRIGRVVTIVGRLVIGSVSSPVGRLAINTGVGANEYPGTYAAAAVFPTGWQAGFTGAPSAVAIPGGATVYLDRFGTGGVAIDVASYAQAGAEVSISLTYTL